MTQTEPVEVLDAGVPSAGEVIVAAAPVADPVPDGVPDDAPAEGGPVAEEPVEKPEPDAEDPEDPEDVEEEPPADPAEVARERFVALVEERVKRLRYSHALTRSVFTAEEQMIRSAVDRRAAVWIPTFTFLATVGSAIAAIALASRVRSDPIDDYGSGFFIVLGAVVLLAASFVTLSRSELYYARLRPHGRVVRTDVADAYDAIRNAPRVFLELGAGRQVLVRISAFLPPAEKLVDALAEYAAVGGTLTRAHPAYDRIIRMRAELEVLALLLEEGGADDASRRALRDPAAPMPGPEQVADYESLGDIAADLHT